MANEFSEGQIVEHRAWGRGKVVIVEPPYMTIQFPSLGADPDASRRKLQLVTDFVTVSSVKSDPDLDAIETGPVARRRGGRAGGAPTRRRKSITTNLEAAIEWFKGAHPGLFEDPKLVSDEIKAKREGHAVFAKHFGKGQARQLLAAQNFKAIAEGLTLVYGATNIPSVFEIRAIKNGLADEAAAGRLLEALQGFLDAPGAEAFAKLTEAVGSLPAATAGSRVLTWPNVTVVPFLADPARFVVLKPEASQKIAGRMDRDLLYSTAPSWPVYEDFLRLSADLLTALRPLGAKDYIDVQSFLWVTRDLA